MKKLALRKFTGIVAGLMAVVVLGSVLEAGLGLADLRTLVLYRLPLVAVLGLCLWLHHRHRRQQQRWEQQYLEQHHTIERQQRELVSLRASRSDMFLDIVHEIRTPLSLIMQLNEAIMIERYGSANNNIKGASRIALSNGRRLINLLEEILELSKLDMIQVALDTEAVGFREYLHGLYAMFRAKAASRRIDYQLQCDLGQDLCVMLDRDKYEKIFNNLVGNALKFTPEYGRVVVTVAYIAPSNRIRLSVADTGPGIDAADLPYIFDRYYQARSGKSAQEGVGIGLALAKNYATLFNGSLSVQSTVGEGTTFVFEFPAEIVSTTSDHEVHTTAGVPSIVSWPDAQTDAYPQLAPAQETGIRPRHHILVVEDNADMRQFLQQFLHAEYEVSVAPDGCAALDFLAASSRPVDFIVSDMIMPRMNGMELLKAIRSDDRWRSLPFLMLTAETRVSYRIDAFTFGVDDYLPKPFSSQELRVRIQSLLSNAMQRRAWHTSEPDADEGDKTADLAEDQDMAEVPPMTAADLAWLKKLEQVVQAEMCNKQVNLSELAHIMAVSERQLFRMIKRMTGLTPNKYLRDIKLHKAKSLLENHTYGTIAEVSYAVGFEDPHYFSKLYMTQFGKRPSDYFVRAAQT